MPEPTSEPLLNVAELFAPLSFRAFVDSWWLRRPLHQRGSPARFSGLLGGHHIEYLAVSLTTHQGWISLVRDGVELPASKIGVGNGFISVGKLRQAQANGFTLLLTSLHRRWPAISGLCRSMEAELTRQGVALSRPIVANAYATPAGAHGLRPHYDDHEVLVLQLEGRKRWRLFNPIIEAPLGRQPEPIQPDRLGPPISEPELHPGDILYIPRGQPHEAIALDEPTLHLTLAIHVHTWLDLATTLLKHDPAFRAALPPVVGTSAQQGTVWSHVLTKNLGRLDASETATASVAAAMRDAFMLGIEPALQVASMRPTPVALSLTTRIAWAPGGFVQCDHRGGDVMLLFPGGRVNRRANYARAFDYISSHALFVLGELPGLTDEAKLQLAADLVAQGCLAIVPSQLSARAPS